MNLKEISRLVLLQVNHNNECGKDEKFTIEEIEEIIKKRVINVLEPNGVYEKDKYYDGLGYYIGIIDTHPYKADYFRREHHFRIPMEGSGAPSKINQILIREIKK